MKILKAINPLLRFLFVTLMISSAALAKSELFRVSVRLLQTRSYCGGAAPTRELLDKLSTPTPVSGKKLFVKKGDRNSDAKTIAAAVSDSAGVLTFHLSRGSYCLVEENKTRPLVVPAGNRWETWNPDCLKKRWETCDYSLQVTGKNEDIRIIYPEYCPETRPCLKSRIPLPP